MEILNLFWGFILTIWNVNSISAILLLITLSAFYINYMECKFNLPFFSNLTTSEFYINYMECKSIGFLKSL
ncbi:hypothetical protein E5F29_03590, partial [Clostridioides difficile]